MNIIEIIIKITLPLFSIYIFLHRLCLSFFLFLNVFVKNKSF